jgi:hypothetical protein
VVAGGEGVDTEESYEFLVLSATLSRIKLILEEREFVVASSKLLGCSCIFSVDHLWDLH